MKSIPLSLGIIHALIDATSAYILFSSIDIHTLEFKPALSLVVFYNLIAFGSQFIIGLVADKFKVYKLFAIAGCVLGILAFGFLISLPVYAVSIVATGNALYHVGAGAISILSSKKRAEASGIFVAPGALGLALGTLAGKNDWPYLWIFILLLLMSAIYIAKSSFKQYAIKRISLTNTTLWILITLILFVIGLRSLIGFSLNLPWKSNIILLMILTLTITLGKAAGGILADKFGWGKVAIFALMLSAPLMTVASKIPLFALIGVFLFQFSMPVTLAATVSYLPNRVGFAFGLTCLALLIGGLPSVSLNLTTELSQFVIFLLVIFAALILFIVFKLPKLRSINNIFTKHRNY